MFCIHWCLASWLATMRPSVQTGVLHNHQAAIAAASLPVLAGGLDPGRAVSSLKVSISG